MIILQEFKKKMNEAIKTEDYIDEQIIVLESAIEEILERFESGE